MENNVNDLLAQEQIIDRLITKAEKLKGILAECGQVPDDRDKPQIVYSVHMGSLMELATAPQAVINPEFLEMLSKHFRQILNTSAMKPKAKPEKKFKESNLILRQS